MYSDLPSTDIDLDFDPGCVMFLVLQCALPPRIMLAPDQAVRYFNTKRAFIYSCLRKQKFLFTMWVEYLVQIVGNLNRFRLSSA